MIYDTIVSRTPIGKGWSGDQKYLASTADGAAYLLRISPVEKLERRRRTFALMQRVYALNVSMCAPVECGLSGEGAYVLLGWIEGEEAETAVPKLSLAQQYACGREAGRILSMIHTLPAPETQEDWEPRFNRKIDRNIRMYLECGAPRENAAKFIDYINANRQLLKNRPQSFQHGDYHIGNMLLDRAGRLTVIDFDRDDFGDPYEEFNRIVWCAHASPRFASGMADGYFGEPVPMDFWRLLALYVFSNQLSSVPWAMQFGEDEVATMQKQAREVLAWYDNLQNPVPNWYASK